MSTDSLIHTLVLILATPRNLLHQQVHCRRSRRHNIFPFVPHTSSDLRVGNVVRGIHNDRLGEYVQEIFKISTENDLGLAISFSCFLGLKTESSTIALHFSIWCGPEARSCQ